MQTGNIAVDLDHAVSLLVITQILSMLQYCSGQARFLDMLRQCDGHVIAMSGSMPDTR